MLNFSNWKVTLTLLICLAGILTVMPNFFSRDQVAEFPSWLPSKQINLGLDLQGGAHLLFEVDVDAVVQERLNTLIDDVRTALRPQGGESRIGYTNLRIDGTAVSFDLNDPSRRQDVVRRMEEIAGVTTGTFGPGAADIDVTSDDDGQITIRLTEAAMEQRKRSAVEQSIEIVRRRIDEMGTREPSIQRQGDDRILVQVPGVDDTAALIETINTTAMMSFRMVDHTTSVEEAERGRIPPGSDLLKAANPQPGEPESYVVRRRVLISGESLVDSQATFQDGQPVVSFRFDSSGGRRFGEATRQNVGRLFAIILDNEVISAPRIREPIMGGSGIIEGNFTVEDANQLSILLRAGALPAPLTILEQRAVGAELGADSVRAGQIAAVIGLVAVVVFIVLVYGLFGVMANAALFLNLALIGGALSTLQATLTLPGIAGIVLTIGMAVDANVLVFERVREEMRTGKSPFAAVDAGYSKALSTILDANITTLIAAAILFEFGSGPIRGFAVTLSIGIITSVFTALVLTRLMIVVWLRRRRPQRLSV